MLWVGLKYRGRGARSQTLMAIVGTMGVRAGEAAAANSPIVEMVGYQELENIMFQGFPRFKPPGT